MKEEEHIEYYSNGEMMYKLNHKDGNAHGKHIYCYENGNIWFMCNYLDGKLHGESIHYYKSGEIESKLYYINNDVVTDQEWLSYKRNIKLEYIL
jgi:antitoxin component YwqK of YwqJK toxin-antitoxin module